MKLHSSCVQKITVPNAKASIVTSIASCPTQRNVIVVGFNDKSLSLYEYEYEYEYEYSPGMVNHHHHKGETSSTREQQSRQQQQKSRQSRQSRPFMLNFTPMSMTWQKRDNILAVGSSDGILELYSMARGSDLHSNLHSNSNSNPSSSSCYCCCGWPPKSIQRNIKAHDGSISALYWNDDDDNDEYGYEYRHGNANGNGNGNANASSSLLATSGVDGEVRIYSKTGILRRRLPLFSEAVYDISWGSTCTCCSSSSTLTCRHSLVAAHGDNLSVIHMQQGQGQGRSNTYSTSSTCASSSSSSSSSSSHHHDCDDSAASAHTIMTWKVQGREEVGMMMMENTRTRTRTRNASVLCVDWNVTSNLIVCGDENGYVRIYNPNGTILCTYTSSSEQQQQRQNYAIMCTRTIIWLHGGDYFAMGGVDGVTLYDKFGIVHDHDGVGDSTCINRHTKYTGTGTCPSTSTSSASVMDVVCAHRYGVSQLIAIRSDGSIQFSRLVGQKVTYRGITLEVLSDHQIGLTYPMIDDHELPPMIDTSSAQSGPIVTVAMGYQHIVILTGSQCLLYSLSSTRTHTRTMELTGSVQVEKDTFHGLSLGPECFVVFGRGGIESFSYVGKYLSSLDIPLTTTARSSIESIAVNHGVVAIVDESDRKVVRLFRIVPGKDMGKEYCQFRHDEDINQICVSCLNTSKREKDDDEFYLVFVDEMKNLYIRVVGNKGYSNFQIEEEAFQLGSQIESIAWEEGGHMLCALAESTVTLFYFPGAPFVDPDLLDQTKEIIHFSSEKGTTNVGKKLFSFCEDQCSILRRDGSLIHISVEKGYSILHKFAAASNWKACVRLCQSIKSKRLWATLACAAIKNDEFDIALRGLVKLQAVQKLERLRHILQMPSGEKKNAEICVYKGLKNKALHILLHADPPLIYDAIKMSIHLLQWEKALSIAQENGDDNLLDIVLWHRVSYLESHKKKEKSTRFKDQLYERGVVPDDQLHRLEDLVSQQKFYANSDNKNHEKTPDETKVDR